MLSTAPVVKIGHLRLLTHAAQATHHIDWAACTQARALAFTSYEAVHQKCELVDWVVVDVFALGMILLDLATSSQLPDGKLSQQLCSHEVALGGAAFVLAPLSQSGCALPVSESLSLTFSHYLTHTVLKPSPVIMFSIYLIVYSLNQHNETCSMILFSAQ